MFSLLEGIYLSEVDRELSSSSSLKYSKRAPGTQTETWVKECTLRALLVWEGGRGREGALRKQHTLFQFEYPKTDWVRSGLDMGVSHGRVKSCRLHHFSLILSSLSFLGTLAYSLRNLAIFDSSWGIGKAKLLNNSCHPSCFPTPCYIWILSISA